MKVDVSSVKATISKLELLVVEIDQKKREFPQAAKELDELKAEATKMLKLLKAVNSKKPVKVSKRALVLEQVKVGRLVRRLRTKYGVSFNLDVSDLEGVVK